MANLKIQDLSTLKKLSDDELNKISGGTNDDNQVVFQDRVRLSLVSSFTGENLQANLDKFIVTDPSTV